MQKKKHFNETFYSITFDFTQIYFIFKIINDIL